MSDIYFILYIDFNSLYHYLWFGSVLARVLIVSLIYSTIRNKVL